MEKALAQSQCKKYMKRIKDLELSCYEQNLLHYNLEKRFKQEQQSISRISNKKINSPGARPDNKLSDAILFIIVFGIPAGLIGGVLGFIWRFIRVIFTDLTMADAPTLLYISWGAGVAFAIVFLFAIACFISGVSPEAVKEWENNVEKYKKELSERDSVLENGQKYLLHLEKLIHECEQRQQETLTVLNKYYNFGYVYPQYRGIVPVCTMYEYLESGRCDSLTGPNGAYNLYEQELLMKTIIGKLDDVIARLDDISDNQRLIAQEIRRSHSELSTMLTSLDNAAQNIEKSTAITEYYGRVTAANTSYLAWADFLRS